MKTHLLLPLLLMCLFVACNDDTTTEPVDTDVTSPTNLRAFSGNGEIGLQWTPSTTVNQGNFGTYRVFYTDKSTGNTQQADFASTTAAGRVTGLKNGTIYRFVMRSVTAKGKLSQDSTWVEWAPAVRNAVDITSGPIRVYATTSQNPSALDLHNENGKAVVMALLSPDFRTKADLFVFAQNAASPIEIVSPHLSQANPGLVTNFSTVPPVEADSLNAQYDTAPPASSTYTAPRLQVPDTPGSKGRVYFGRVKRGNDDYSFRLFIKRGATGSLVQGAGVDRYLEFEISYQNVRNVPFSKK